MSKKAYSKDLRERVINHIKSGNTQINTSKTFNISTSTVKLGGGLFIIEKIVIKKKKEIYTILGLS